MKCRMLLLQVLVFTAPLVSFAQDNLWSNQSSESAAAYIAAQQNTIPQNFRLIKLNRSMATVVQQQALPENLSQFSLSGTSSFDLPLPDGKTLSTLIFESSILSPELKLANPGLKTYLLIDPKTKNIAARLTISPAGVSGIIFTDQGTAYISPLGATYPDMHMVYYVKDSKVTAPIVCATKEDISNLQPAGILAGDCKKRVYRLAVAATGEYTVWAGSQSNALTAITTTVNDITAIYERDATISFTLVTNNNIIYADSLADPYATTSFPSGTTLNANQAAEDANITTGNYDLGIVFNYGWNGGLAQLSVVCNAAAKGKAAAGLTFGTGANPTPGPQGPIFAGTVAHEMAHEFSATHTFVANNGGCAGNTTVATSYEPGGGSTLMAYAGTCTGNAYQNNSDLYFHAGSIAQIQAYATSASGACASPITISNTPPAISVPAGSYTIPVSTPFTLSATGSDADGNALTYTWEQMDAATAATSLPPASTNTNGPNFRSYPPNASPSRTFPPLANIIANTTSTYEVLSSVTRTMNFRATVRDNASGGGCTAEANVAVTTNSTAGPFTVTSQSSPVTWTANGTNTATITWNVANTTAAPVSCSAVDILFSIDGGLTYPYTLAANTGNDGTETIIIPNLVTSIGRVKVQSRNNIFFNINTADITIASSCAAEGATFTPSTSVTAPAGDASLDLSLTPQYGTVVTTSGQLDAGDPATILAIRDSVSGNPDLFSNSYRYDKYSFTVSASGSYTFVFSPGIPFVLNLYSGSFDPSNPAANWIASSASFGNVSGFVHLTTSLTASLVPGRFYTLTIGTFAAGSPAIPASYSINTSGPGSLVTGPADPGAGFSYTYVIVDSTSGIIKAIDPSANLSSSGTFPGGTYIVYGLSYSNAIAPATLNSYIGGPFTTLYNDLLFKPATLCGNLSKDNAFVTITAALPVQLLPLQAFKTGKTVLVSWATASEQNSDHFEVLRSANGTDFNKILGSVAASGTSNSKVDYSFTDQSPEAQWNYYRVKEVDKDGRSMYTNIARINFNDKFSALITYPNPTKSVLTATYFTDKSGMAKLLIIDGKGSVLKETTFNAQLGKNTQQINVANLAAGTYLLRIVNSNEVLVSRFVKE